MKLKDKKIEICEVTTAKDAEGFSGKILTPIHTGKLWAYFRQLSGKEVRAADAVHAVEDVLFTVNYRSDISTAHIVRYGDVLYDITRVDVFEGYTGDLTLYCKRRA